MSRFSEADEYDVYQILAWGRWSHNAKQVIQGKKGQAFLREFLAALEAWPEKRLILNAVARTGYAHIHDGFGEVVETPCIEACAIGAFAIMKGKSPVYLQDKYTDKKNMFRGYEYEPISNIDETKDAGMELGLSGMLSEVVAWLNDEEFGNESPERRYQGILAWVRNAIADPVGMSRRF